MAQWGATQAAALLAEGLAGLGQEAPLQSEAIEAGVHRNHAGQAFLVGQAGDRIDGIVLQIRGDLHQQGRATRQPPQPLHQSPQQHLILELAQPRGIRGAHVDHGIVSQRSQ
jgi:hypothetical protein